VSSADGPTGGSLRIEGDAHGNVRLVGPRTTVTLYDAHLLLDEAAPRSLSGLYRPRSDGFPPNPYRGIAAFAETDAFFFFGREELTKHLWQRYRQLHEVSPDQPPKTRLLALLGPSGSGKSSLARAGLIPALIHDPPASLPVKRVAAFVPGAHPLRALAEVLSRIGLPTHPPPEGKIDELVATLMREGERGARDGLSHIADHLPEASDGALLVLVDQLEEIYALCDDASERRAFIDNLLYAARDLLGRVSIVATLRSDFLGRTQQHPGLSSLLAEQGVLVPAMTREELERAASKPAAQAGHPLANATVERIATDAEGREGALPLLQFTMTRIWEGMSEGRAPKETLAQLGGVGGALGGEAERLYSGLPDGKRKIAQQAFLAMIRRAEGEPDTRRRVPVEDLVAPDEDPADVREVLQTFSQPAARLILLSAGPDGREMACVTHEALLDHWAQLRTWLAESREDERYLRRVEEATQRWEANSQAEGLLFRAPELDLLRRFAERSEDRLTDAQRSFLRASEELFRAEKAAARRQEEKARLRTRLVKITGAILVAGLAVLLGLASWAAWERRREQLGLARLYADQGKLAQLKGDSLKAALYLGEASRRGELDPALRSLLGEALRSVEALESTVRVGVQKDLDSRITAFDPGLDRFLLSSSGSVKVTDARKGSVLASLPVASEGSAWSPDGALIATFGNDEPVRVWEAASGRLIDALPPRAKDSEIAWSPDGSRLFTFGDDGRAQLWDLRAPKPSTSRLVLGPARSPKAAKSVTFSPDGQRVILASGNVVETWQIADQRRLASVEIPMQSQIAVDLSPSGLYALDRTLPTQLVVWDVARGAKLSSISGTLYSFEEVRWSSDDKHLISMPKRGRAVLWELPGGERITDFGGRALSPSQIAFSRDGSKIVTAGFGDAAKVWDARTGALHATLPGPVTAIAAVALSRGGERAAIASAGAVHLWNVARLAAAEGARTASDPDPPPEDRSPEEIRTLLRCRLPFHFEEEQLLPGPADPGACLPRTP
jgi:WD40 repeat protein